MTDITPERCVTLCGQQEYLYSGLQNGIECYGGNDPFNPAEKGDISNCQIPCPGDASQTCGGQNTVNVYQGKITK